MDGNAKRILLVEGDRVAALEISSELEEKGYLITHTASGEKAVAFIQDSAEPFDLILMDLDLDERMDGAAAARTILSTLDIPIVFLSCHTEEEFVRRTDGIVSCGYVAKNADIALLKASISTAFKLHEARRRLRKKDEEFSTNNAPFRIPEAETKRTMEIMEDIGKDFFNPSLEQLDYRKLADYVREVTHAAHAVFNVYDEDTKQYGTAAVSSEQDIMREVVGILGFDLMKKQWPSDERLEMERKGRPLVRYESFSRFMNRLIPEKAASAIETLLGTGECVRMMVERENVILGDFIVLMPSGASITNEKHILAVLQQIGMLLMRRRMQEKLDESDERFRLLFDRMTDGMAVCRIVFNDKEAPVDYEFVEVNNAFLSITGLDRDAVVSRRATEVFPEIPTEPDKPLARFSEVALTGEPASYETYVEKADRWFHFYSYSPKKNYFVMLMHDLTALKTTEIELRKNLTFLRNILNSTDDFIFVKDKDLKTVLCNPAVAQAVGKNPDQMYGKTDLENGWDPLYVKGDSTRGIRGYEKDDLDALAGNAVHNPYDRGIFDGKEIIYDTKKMPLYNDHGTIEGILGIGRNVTERVEMEDELRRLLREKDLLVKELQHRVKNNLNIIGSILSLEARRVSDGTIRDLLFDIRSRVQTMSGIYEQLYRSGTIGYLDLDLYFSDYARNMERVYVYDTARIIISSEVGPVQLDLKRAVPLVLIMNELVTNAIKYAFPGNREGEIRISGEIRGNCLEIGVSDNGIGFESGLDPHKAESMGFMLIRLLCEQIGADADFSSKHGKGTAVHLRLPLEMATA